MAATHDVLAALRRVMEARCARGLRAEMLEVREVAALLHVHRYTIYRYINANKLPAVRVGRRYLIPAVTLERLLEEALASVNKSKV